MTVRKYSMTWFTHVEIPGGNTQPGNRACPENYLKLNGTTVKLPEPFYPLYSDPRPIISTSSFSRVILLVILLVYFTLWNYREHNCWLKELDHDFVLHTLSPLTIQSRCLLIDICFFFPNNVFFFNLRKSEIGV